MEMMCFQSYWFQLKSATPAFLRKSLVFQKIKVNVNVKVNVLKTLKTFTDCNINEHADLSNVGLF